MWGKEPTKCKVNPMSGALKLPPLRRWASTHPSDLIYSSTFPLSTIGFERKSPKANDCDVLREIVVAFYLFFQFLPIYISFDDNCLIIPNFLLK